MITNYTMPNGKDMNGLANTLESYLRFSKKMDTQNIPTGDGFIIQARYQGGGSKQLLGMDNALSVRVSGTPDNGVVVEIGNAKWGNKVAAMTVSMFVFWPLLFTSAAGMFQQKQLFSQVNNEIARYMYA